MRNRILKQWLAMAALALILPCSASAAGLGRLTILSTLGQPLNAEVELLSVQKGETITARLASPEVYQQAGAQYNNVLTGTRVTLERRPSGEQYLKITTARPISEPFLELLIEINSEHGRVVRQYTALLDPPGYGRAAGEIPPPVTTRAPEPSAPAAATPAPPPPSPVAEGPLAAPERRAPAAPAPKRVAAPAPTPRAAPAPGAAAEAAPKQYGPVKPGETLRKIARAVRPEGVSLEQTLVGLYRQNPDAFINKNMNLVKSGKILRVPEASEIAALAPQEASQEVRMQVADFNAYRDRVADRPATAPEEGSVRSGRIGSRVTERGAAEGPRDTVRISRGEPPGKAKGAGRMNTEERLRALEEEVIAREKALAEANERIGQLEQIIKDTQRAMELKSAGAGSAQKGAEKSATSAQPDSSTVAVAPPVAPAAKPQEQPAPPAKAAPAEQPPTADAQKQRTPAEPAPAAKAEPAQKAKAAPAPEPPKEPSFMSTLLDEPLYLAAGGAAVLLGGLAFMIVRRRRQAEHDAEDPDDGLHIAPRLGGSGGGAAEETWPVRNTIENAAARDHVAATPASAPKVTTTSMRPPAALPAASPRMTSEDNDLDFDLEVRRAGAAGYATEPRETAQPNVVARSGPPSVEQDSQPNEFKLDPLPPVDAPMEVEKVSSEPPPSVDFKLDLNDLDVNAPSQQAGAAGRDDHWHDVQQKFDLAKSYEQMGDKRGARDILQEVLREGDKDQQALAKKLLESLS